MKKILAALPLLLAVAACKKNKGESENITFSCSGGSGYYLLVYSDPGSGKLLYADGPELSLTLAANQSTKVTASDQAGNPMITLSLKVNGLKMREDRNKKPVIEYKNVQ